MKKNIWIRVLESLIGVVFISLSVALLRYADLGTDPFTCFNLGVSNMTHLSFGTAQFMVGIIFLLILVWFEWRYFGLGTVFGVVLIGYISDFIVGILPGNATEVGFFIRFLLVFGALLSTSFGISLYSYANLGISSYDALSFITTEKANGRFKFSYVRIVIDVLLVVFGVLMGGPLGIGTLVIAFFTGPLVNYFLNAWKKE